MNAPTKSLMLLDGMAAKYGLRVEEFSATVRATCGLPNASPEEFAAFVSVCREYGLNPITREIYALPRRGGGLIPVVGIDGWIHLINDHPAADGFEFDVHEADGALTAITCRMYRKDRSHPVTITEYLSECRRDTEPWKMQHRMLRHKALIQAARYAFGFSGIYDEDEAERFAQMRDVTPPSPPKPPSKQDIPVKTERVETTPPKHRTTPPKPPVKAIIEEKKDRISPLPPHDAETGEVIENEPSGFAEDQAPGDMLSELDDALATAKTSEDIDTIYDDYDVEARLQDAPQGEEFIGVAIGIRRRHLKRVTNG